VCLGLSLLSNSLWLSRITSSYLSCNSSCNSLLARITKQSKGSDVWCLVATSLATEKISVATQHATQLHESRYKSNGLEFYWAISYFWVYWEIAKPFLKIYLNFRLFLFKPPTISSFLLFSSRSSQMKVPRLYSLSVSLPLRSTTWDPRRTFVFIFCVDRSECIYGLATLLFSPSSQALADSSKQKIN
jgi:hypothetical protein